MLRQSGGALLFRIEILNSFSGDDKSEIDTSTEGGRAEAAKLVADLLRSGSAVFLEREVDGVTLTHRVTGYDPVANKLTIRIDAKEVADAAVEPVPRKKGRGRPKGIARRASYGRVSPEAGRTVAVAPRSGG
jgi:hypothetical protein